MNKQHLYGLINPFERIAGLEALLWGLAGMGVSTALSYYSGWHYHGLLHFGPAPNPAWWCYAVEHLAVWLIPAVMFYLGGLLLSRSRIRMVDVLGTVVFAQLPLIVMNLFNMSPAEIMQQPGFIVGMWLSLVAFVFMIWTLVWMFQALKVSCNLKGYRLGILYCVGIFGGDMLCRYLIKWLCY